ncbi:hypothetical protein ACQ4PT_043093 [Festuca glaucescens]
MAWEAARHRVRVEEHRGRAQRGEVFQYGASHNVAEVGSADHNACSATNSIQSYSDQDNKIKLAKPGMKLAVTVAPAPATTPTAPAAPSKMPSEPSPETPSTLTPHAATTTTTPATSSETPSEPSPEKPSTSMPQVATTMTTLSSGKTANSVGGASGVETRFVMGTLIGAIGLVSLALTG